MGDATTFELTLERIALIRRMVVAWNPVGNGAPIVHPDAPYGSADRDDDIFNVTGDDEGADEEHRALGDALALFLLNAVLKPGRYAYHNTLAKLDSRQVSDVFWDDATGLSPEHVTFDVTAEHLALIPHLNLEWDEDYDVPGIDPDLPYGAYAHFAGKMATLLGIPLAKDEQGDPIVPDELSARLSRLHHEMQPALQIFLRYADLGPGFFRQREGRAGWEPV